MLPRRLDSQSSQTRPINAQLIHRVRRPRTDFWVNLVFPHGVHDDLIIQ